MLTDLLKRCFLFCRSAGLFEASYQLLDILWIGWLLWLRLDTGRGLLHLWSDLSGLLELLLVLVGSLVIVGKTRRWRGSVGDGRTHVDGRIDAIGEHWVLELRILVLLWILLTLPIRCLLATVFIYASCIIEHGIRCARRCWMRADLSYVALTYLGNDAWLLDSAWSLVA